MIKVRVLIIISPVTKTPFVLLNKHNPVVRKQIPIAINNTLPCIDLFLKIKKDLNNTMRILVDSGAATNIGNKIYHRWIITQYLDIIAEYMKCGSGLE